MVQLLVEILTWQLELWPISNDVHTFKVQKDELKLILVKHWPFVLQLSTIMTISSSQ